MGRPEWRDYLRPYVAERARIIYGRGVPGEEGKESSEMAAAARILVGQFLDSIPPEERTRVISYFLVGSANMDYRSMLMDGEAMVLVAGVRALDALLDLAEIEGLSRWVETQAEIDRALPLPPMGLGRLLARWGKRLL
jgi:hypothetical protein